MSTPGPVSVSDVLDFQASSSAECSVNFPPAICIGSVTVGGLVASVATKYALSYASKHPKLRFQTDLRDAAHQFYRPIMPANGIVTMKLHEVNVGRGWSNLRVELFQGEPRRICASANIIISNLSLPGVTLPTGWHLSPPAHRVDLSQLESHADPDWVCYHVGFYPNGFRRGQSYAKNFIPVHWPPQITYVEQWVVPGWDCTPLGSRDASKPPARWTNDMIEFVTDLILPVQENFILRKPDQPKPLGSIAATLDFALAQNEARERGDHEWRKLMNDGSLDFEGSLLINSTLSMSTEIKKRLPAEGVRWLYLRSEAKRVQNSRMDLEVLVFDEEMDLVAISHQDVHLIPADLKNTRTSAI
ncbi:thioesterase-like superfamily-domain-containing protein [Talaromyces proteolyticus]|uniref:Thioesterase-like superfamily-domain-containing protein n=1 Tax=Talaromyces proteolyticus TaxID=1131652 RepID=A0AAD4KMR2_9EURO|nr:thioesterase-like superfamily-domain-containing protein [Talaromyces proteolyticus]KAH8695167.1 thioesterase-like superfamily-domain-containing protein [Talaromyces proteolyticus]